MLLRTDGYKFSMAEAGFPLRRETFYLSFRRGGWQHVPFDLESYVRRLLPFWEQDDKARAEFLVQHGYSLSLPMRQALGAEVEIHAVPPRSWVYEREPIITITGPSFLVSWLEPCLLRLFYPLQLATILAQRDSQDPAFLKAALTTCCSAEAAIAQQVCDSMGIDVSGETEPPLPHAYQASVKRVADRLLALVKDPNRIFEVGMRSATCNEQHRLCLTTLRDLGITQTSNVEAAYELDMVPVGTMGHEHVQRWGRDLDAYRAMRDMRIGRPTYLLDTFDTITSGIPAVTQVLRERAHDCGIRYDSGDKFGQHVYAHGEFKRLGLEPVHVIEDGLDFEATAQFELLRQAHTHLPPTKQVYGYGGYLVHGDWGNPITRDRVSAVYKLSETSGEPRMKFGNEAGLGKTSVPGRPVTWRRLRGSGPISVIAQIGEPVPEDYVCLNGASYEDQQALKLCRSNDCRPSSLQHTLSPATQSLVDGLRARHNARNL